MSPTRRSRLLERLEALDEQGLRRRLKPLTPTGPTTAQVDGREVDVFSSNDYLGLAWELEWSGHGVGSSRLIAGDRGAHHALEEALQERFGQRALVFTSGYQANLAVLTTLFEDGQTVASDAMNHASLIDGLRLSRARVQVTPHREAPPACDGYVCESLYSMDGDRGVPHRGDHWLVVDAAHSVGTAPPPDHDVLIGTFGKAYGAAGAFVCAPDPLIELLISRGRSFVYTTGLAEPAARAALEGLRRAPERAERLRDRVARFRATVDAPGEDHIIPIVLGERTMDAAARLLDAGIYVPGIRWPTVARGQERLRFSLSAAHTDDQIDRALEALQSLS